MSGNNNDGNWIGDGTEGCSLISNENGEVTATAAKQGRPFNVRAMEAIPSDCSSFFVDILECSGNVSIGLVTAHEFRPGWKTRGMFYNGNVTNGSAALITGFGKYLEEGDTVGVRKFKNNNKTEVQFVVNGENLGTAFQLEDDNGGKDIYYPCVHVSGTVKFVCQAGQLLNENVGLLGEGGYAGSWKLESLEMHGKRLELLPDDPIIIALEGDPVPTHISIKVANTIFGSIQVLGQGEDAIGGPGALDVKVGPMGSTLMMPRPPLDKIEQTVTAAFRGISKMTLVMGYLYMSGSGDGNPELQASRYTKNFKPLAGYR